jgi:hypothetical protein
MEPHGAVTSPFGECTAVGVAGSKYHDPPSCAGYVAQLSPDTYVPMYCGAQFLLSSVMTDASVVDVTVMPSIEEAPVGPPASDDFQVAPPSLVCSSVAGVAGQAPVVARQATVSFRAARRRVGATAFGIAACGVVVAVGVGRGVLGAGEPVVEETSFAFDGVTRTELMAQPTRTRSTMTKAMIPTIAQCRATPDGNPGNPPLPCLATRYS